MDSKHLVFAVFLGCVGMVGCVESPAPIAPPATPQIVVKTACIQPVPYTADQQKAVAEEMRSHVTPTAEDQFILDYARLRAENRAACKS